MAPKLIPKDSLEKADTDVMTSFGTLTLFPANFSRESLRGYWSGFMQGSKENKQLMRQKKVYIQCSNVCIMGLKLF